MSALIPIREHAGKQAVSGRELHAFLELGRDYTTWFKKMTGYGLVEGTDYLTISGEVARQGRGTVERIDHALTLDAAKEIAMIQRTEKGKQARAYFIEVEKRYRAGAVALPQTYAEALRELADQAEKNATLAAQIEQDAPKVLFADSVATSKSTILVGELAKILKGNGVEIGATRLFEKLREDGYLIKREGSDRNMPTQRSMELGLFKIKETSITHSDGHVSISKTPKVTGKGQQYFINRYAPKRHLRAAA